VRVFLDTNVLASGFATRGLCAELLEAVIGEHELLTCEAVLQELQRVLADKFRLPKPVIAGYIGLLRAEGQIVAATGLPAITLSDPDDTPIVACAVAVKADVFVTGDKSLLDLAAVGGVPIASPRQFWQTLTGLR
jgi:putative PIN family toxin of toxin-antitoxin system